MNIKIQLQTNDRQWSKEQDKFEWLYAQKFLKNRSKSCFMSIKKRFTL